MNRNKSLRDSKSGKSGDNDATLRILYSTYLSEALYYLLQKINNENQLILYHIKRNYTVMCLP